jgi:pimeloyl-ACP methyl ester carboxylesterase
LSGARIELARDTYALDARYTVVLLHGLTSSRTTYSSLIPWLLDKGFGVVNLDLRGHGETGWAHSYRAVDYADDVAQTMDRLGVGPAVLAGHSLGGVVATALTGARPDLVRGLFMEDPPLYQGDDAIRDSDEVVAGFPEFAEQLRRWQRDATPLRGLVADYGRSESPYPGLTVLDLMGPERVEARVEAFLACDPAAVDGAYEGELWAEFDPVPSIDVPVTVLAADPALDAMFHPDHADMYRAAVTQSRIVAVQGIAHSIRLTEPGLEIYKKELDGLIASV